MRSTAENLHKKGVPFEINIWNYAIQISSHVQLRMVPQQCNDNNQQVDRRKLKWKIKGTCKISVIIHINIESILESKPNESVYVLDSSCERKNLLVKTNCSYSKETFKFTHICIWIQIPLREYFNCHYFLNIQLDERKYVRNALNEWPVHFMIIKLTWAL